MDEALRDLEVDSDTQGVAGQPPIVETIFKKIDSCAVFVADMTLVGIRDDGCQIPNPNVLIEYGWALKALTHQRVIWVMNTAFGEPSGENLPFDLRHTRRPMGYSLPSDATPELKKKEKQKLVKSLTVAIQASLATLPTPVVDTPPRFQEASAKDGPARFRESRESLGFEDDDSSFSAREVFLVDGPAMWLRLMPLTDPARRWTVSQLKEQALTIRPVLMPLVYRHPGCSHLRAEDGIGIFQMTERETGLQSKSVRTASSSFAFETGEIWSIDTSLLRDRPDRLPFAESYFVDAMRNYGLYLQSLGVPPPYRWIAGIVGVKGRFFNLQRYERLAGGHRCVTDLITAEGLYSCEQDPTQALLVFFERIFDKCGLSRT